MPTLHVAGSVRGRSFFVSSYMGLQVHRIGCAYGGHLVYFFP